MRDPDDCFVHQLLNSRCGTITISKKAEGERYSISKSSKKKRASKSTFNSQKSTLDTKIAVLRFVLKISTFKRFIFRISDRLNTYKCNRELQFLQTKVHSLN